MAHCSEARAFRPSDDRVSGWVRVSDGVGGRVTVGFGVGSGLINIKIRVLERIADRDIDTSGDLLVSIFYQTSGN